jgi:hypothetical protein
MATPMGLLGGINEEEMQQQAMKMAALQAGLTGLMASGPSLSPVSTGQVLGQMGLTGVGAYQQGLQQAQQQQVQKQIQQATQSALGGGQGGGKLDGATMAKRLETLAAQLMPFAPDKAKYYMDMADKYRGNIAKYTGEMANLANTMFGTNEVDKLTPEQRNTVDRMMVLRDLQSKAAGASRTSVQNIVGGPKLSPYEESRDKAFAPEAQAWMAGGGGDVNAQLAQLKPVLEKLENGEPITGVKVAVQPDLLLALTNPAALQARDQIEEVVQRNLRVILGAQFTEKEGAALISRAYNPKLGPEENAKRIAKLFMQMSTAAEQKQKMVDYANETGSLRGFKGSIPSINDFYRAIEGQGAQAPKSPPAGNAPGKPTSRFNPVTGRVEEIR